MVEGGRTLSGLRSSQKGGLCTYVLRTPAFRRIPDCTALARCWRPKPASANPSSAPTPCRSLASSRLLRFIPGGVASEANVPQSHGLEAGQPRRWMLGRSRCCREGEPNSAPSPRLGDTASVDRENLDLAITRRDNFTRGSADQSPRDGRDFKRAKK